MRWADPRGSVPTWYMTLPAVPDSFYWTQQSWGSALRCHPLQAVAPHLFTTRQLPLSSHADWEQVATAVGAERIATLTQVHGRDAVVVRHGHRDRQQDARRPEADILVSDDPVTALAVRAADCVPLLLADPTTGAVAAVHAGWRGTAAGAATAAVEKLAREFSAQPQDLIAAIGPSIGACCYEVGAELIDAFLAAGHARRDVDRWFMTRANGAKPRLDTWAANRDQLMMAGVLEENIHISGLCTASNVDLFPSYRVEKENTGRLVGVIKAKGKRVFAFSLVL
jgi:polyphenol oxidase